MHTTTAPTRSIAAPVSQQFPRSVKAHLLLLVAFLAIYGGSLFSPALLDDADSTHAEAAREMLLRGDYVTLHVNGVRYLEKAPLPYWLVAFSYRVFGVNEFAARLPTALAVLLLGVLGMRWGQRAFGDRVGTYAALFIFTAAGVYLFTRILIPEALLTLLIAASLYFFLTALLEGQWWRWYAGYASVALAVLTKGLVALVFVGAPAVIYLFASGDWRRWREFRLFSGLALLFAIAAPWHILAGLRNKRFFWFYFVNEHFLRFLGKRYPADYNKLPAALYWSLHLVWLFPWVLFLPVAVSEAFRNWRFLRSSSSETAGSSSGSRARLLCWIWAGVILVFFSFSTNQEYYTFPAYFPILLLLAAAVASREELRPGDRWLTISTVLVCMAAVIGGAALIAGLWHSRDLPYVADVGEVLSAHNMAEDTLSMSHALDLSAASLAGLRLPAILAASALLLAPLGSLALRIRGKHWLATWTLAGGMALSLIAAHIALGRFGTYLSSKSLAERIAAQATPADYVAIYGDQAFGSSLLFYLKRPVQLVNGNTTSMWFGSTYPDAPKIFLNDAQLLREWSGLQRVFLFVPPHQRAQVDSLLAQKFVIAESSRKVIYSNRP